MAVKYDGSLIQKSLELLKGAALREALLSAIKQADEAQDHYYRMFFRYQYAVEVCFHDDPPKAMPVAVEFSSIFEEHPDLFGPVGGEMYIMIMQIAIDPVVSLPQIPISQWEEMMDQYYQLIKRFNMGHRTYWSQKSQFMVYVDKEKAFEYFQRFWKTGRDDLSDCRACERSFAVRMHLLMGDEEGAAVHAKPIKQRRLSFCNDTPHRMLRAYIEYAMDKGDLKMAIPYARELKRIGHRDRGDLSYIGAVLRCFAFSDLEQGVTLMANSFPWAAGLWDEKMAYDFYKGAGAVLHQLSKKEEHIPLALPEQFSCFRRDGVYPVKELEQWVYGQAEEIAGRFDARNGTNYFMDNLGLAVNYERI